MEKNAEIARLLDVARDFRFAMLTTIAEDKHLHARPMTIAELDEEDGAIWFLAAKDHASISEIQRDARALVTMQGDGSYVQWSGRAAIVDDPMRIHEVWKPSFSLWFPKGPEEGRLALIRVDIEVGEYWDQSGVMKLRTMLRRAKDAIAGRDADETPRDERVHGRVSTQQPNGRGAS
ncbi:pyridoxamine 5'-phosphate oxidase family protein [Sandaracinus amylolyticus]|uniref:General stress protein n=1 Tax=Sandaracinus amylolyticus TaxID=927083 RepID=A0A0F6SHN5_9BACT|nr:pyridoxamine 5'-phosphate oxidase family protein [Sandaracinus amylolyticus]AKF10754.1 general stress protein [Sandaracinus amylolyticus]